MLVFAGGFLNKRGEKWIENIINKFSRILNRNEIWCPVFLSCR